MKNYFGRFLLMTFLFTQSGCYYRATISSLKSPLPNGDGNTPKIDTNLKLAHSSEIVSGSSQYKLTLPRNYNILSSVGNFNRDLATKTPRGYTIFWSTQGVIVSSEITTK